MILHWPQFIFDRVNSRQNFTTEILCFCLSVCLFFREYDGDTIQKKIFTCILFCLLDYTSCERWAIIQHETLQTSTGTVDRSFAIWRARFIGSVRIESAAQRFTSFIQKLSSDWTPSVYAWLSLERVMWRGYWQPGRKSQGRMLATSSYVRKVNACLETNSRCTQSRLVDGLPHRNKALGRWWDC